MNPGEAMRALLTAAMNNDIEEGFSDEQALLIEDMLVETLQAGPAFIGNVLARLLMFTTATLTTLIELMPGDRSRDEVIADLMLKLVVVGDDEPEELF